MFINIITNIYLEVEDEDQAEQACNAINMLASLMRNNSFPHGEVIDSDVDHYEELTKAQVKDLGFDE